MYYKSFLIKYAEIGVKGKNRYIFEEALVKQLEGTLRKTDGKFKVSRTTGRIYIDADGDYDYDEVVSRLQKVFGVTGICPLLQIDDNGFEDTASKVVEYLKEEYGDESFSFKVDSRRARKNYPMTSPEINAAIGEKILEEMPNLSVNVHNPDKVISVEIREHINVYSKVIKGAGGMPTGTAGKAMLLLSGGIDSPVAGYMIAKRGVVLEATYFHAPPYTSERAKQKVIDLAKIVAQYSGPIRLNVVNFTDPQLYIYETCPHDQLTIIMRRYMMKIAEHFAKESKCLGLVTGESIGQVASQTMQSLLTTNAVCELPVYRPLIAFDKQDIVDISEKIGSYETSIQPYEDCCTIFVAKHPVTKPILKGIEKSEYKLGEKMEELVKTAIETVEVIEID